MSLKQLNEPGRNLADEKSTYLLRFGSASDSDVMVRLSPTVTLGESLKEVVRRGVQRGLLPADCSSEGVDVAACGRKLDIDKSLAEQGVTEHELLEIQPERPKIILVIDALADKNQKIEARLLVEPTRPVTEQLKSLRDKWRESYRFFGRRLRKYTLWRDGKKIHPGLSLQAQNISEEIVTLHLKPRILFEWPPGLYWPPGPFTTYTLVTALVFTLLLMIWRPWDSAPITSVRLVYRSSTPVKLWDVAGDREIDQQDGVTVDTGCHTFRVYSPDFPFFDTTLVLLPRTQVEDSIDTVSLDLRRRFAGSSITELRVSGCLADASPTEYISRSTPILVNRFPVTLAAAQLMLRRDVPRGQYEIKFDLPDESLRRITVNGLEINALGFILNLTEHTMPDQNYTSVVFWYRCPPGETES